MIVQAPSGVDPSMIPTQMPPPGLISNFEDPPDLKVPTLTVLVILMALSLPFMIGRILSNFTQNRKPGLDDVITVVAFFFVYAYSAYAIHEIKYSRHTWDIPLLWYDATYFKIGFAFDLIGVIATCSAKLAILALYLRLFKIETWVRNAIYATMALTCVIYLSNLFVYTGMCIPRSRETWGSFTVGLRCEKTFKWLLAQACLVVILDTIIMSIPVPCLTKIHFSRKIKTGVGMVFLTASLGVIAAAIALWNRVLLFTKPDFSWYVATSLIVANVENHVALIVGSAPATASFVKRKLERTDGTSFFSFPFLPFQSRKKHVQDSLELELPHIDTYRDGSFPNNEIAFPAFTYSTKGLEQEERTENVRHLLHFSEMTRSLTKPYVSDR